MHKEGKTWPTWENGTQNLGDKLNMLYMGDTLRHQSKIIYHVNRCRLIFQRVKIPKGSYSERFLFRTVIILKIFITKDHYSKRFLSQRVIILKFGIMTLRNSLQNNDPSG